MASVTIEVDDGIIRTIEGNIMGYSLEDCLTRIIERYHLAPDIRTEGDRAALAFVRMKAAEMLAQMHSASERPPSNLNLEIDHLVRYITEGG